jgi:hypothetical protein
MSTREEIDAYSDLAVEQVDLPGGVVVRIREMGAAAALALAEMPGTDQERGQALLAACIVDESGEPLYDREGIARLYKNKSMKTVRKLIDAARRVNGFEESDVKKD